MEPSGIVDIEGELPFRVRERVERLGDLLGGTGWGSTPPGRVVVTHDFSGALRAHLSAHAFASFEDRQRARASQDAAGVGMGFRARDGILTAIVDSTGRGPDEVLTLIGHEMLECALSQEKDLRHEIASMSLDEAMKRRIWSEYVVELRRRAIFRAERWSPSKYDHSHLNAVADDYEHELPQLIRWSVDHNAVPDRTFGHWQLITSEVVNASARADAEFEPEADELRRFLRRQASPPEVRAWTEVRTLLPELYGQPELPVHELDSRCLTAWHRVWEVLRSRWNELYERAL